MQKTFGERLRMARQKASLSGPGLAKLLGVSAQTVSEWERDKYMPEATRLRDIASYVFVRVDWLLGGTDGPVEHASDGLGRLVPSLDAKDLAAFTPEEFVSGRARIMSHFSCGAKSFHLLLWENDNFPSFKPGESIIVDPDIELKPGLMVLAIVDGKPHFRRYRPRGNNVILVAENQDYEPIERPAAEVKILGVLSEHSRSAR